jgi:hypothetical protein
MRSEVAQLGFGDVVMWRWNWENFVLWERVTVTDPAAVPTYERGPIRFHGAHLKVSTASALIVCRVVTLDSDAPYVKANPLAFVMVLGHGVAGWCRYDDLVPVKNCSTMC